MSEIEREENLSDPAPLLLAQADLDLERYLRAGGIASRADVRSLLRLLDAERAKVARVEALAHAWSVGVGAWESGRGIGPRSLMDREYDTQRACMNGLIAALADPEPADA